MAGTVLARCPSMLSLYGGGLQQAILQVSFVYYAASVALHWIGPWLFPVKSIQVQQRQEGQVIREAIYSLGKHLMRTFGAARTFEHFLTPMYLSTGPIVVKAAVLTVVEKLHAAGISKLYSGFLDSWPKV